MASQMVVWPYSSAARMSLAMNPSTDDLKAFERADGSPAVPSFPHTARIPLTTSNVPDCYH